MAHKTKESRKKKEIKKKNLQLSLPQAVWQKGQHPSPQSPELQAPIARLETKGISPELLPSRLNFLFLLCLLSFSVWLTFHHYVLIPYTFPLLMLQSIVLPPNYSFCSFLSILSPCLCLPHPPSYTYHPQTSLLYQHTHPQPPAIFDTSILHYNSRNTPKHKQGLQNPAAPMPLLPLTPLMPSLLVPPLPITQVSISSQTKINPHPTPTVYYHQGVLYIIGKPLVWHWTCEFGFANLHLHARVRNHIRPGWC
jgi:hypothetical protein